MDRQEPLGVLDSGVHFQTVADDARVLEEPVAVLGSVLGDAGDFVAVVGAVKALLFLENRFPRQPGLVDLEQQAAEKAVVILYRRAILPIVVVAVDIAHRALAAVGAIRHNRG